MLGLKVYLKRFKRLPRRMQVNVLLIALIVIIGVGSFIWALASGKIRPFAATNDVTNTATVTWTDLSGQSHSASSNTVTTTVTIPDATVDLKANNSDGPVTINSGGAVNLSWTSTNATACIASGDWSGDKAVPTGTESITNITANKTFILNCGAATDSVAVTVQQGGTTVDLKANNSDGPITVASGSTVALTWTTTNATTCTASGDWSGSKAVPSGSENFTIANSLDKTFTLTCDGINDTVIVHVMGQGINFSLTMVLEGRKAGENAVSGAVLKIYNTGSTKDSTSIQEKTDLSFDNQGRTTFNLLGLPQTQNYDFRLKVAGYLMNLKTNISVSNNVNLDFGTLRAGDLNNDNQVNGGDWSLMSPKWFQADPSYIADINRDGQVNAGDWSLMSSNWFKNSD